MIWRLEGWDGMGVLMGFRWEDEEGEEDGEGEGEGEGEEGVEEGSIEPSGVV
tara:strand:+ start:190 stop:345 length:156 start_codon:yes stop_codon:yes gene_type:complete